MSEQKFEMSDIKVSEQGSGGRPDSASLIEKQTRTRRLFSTSQLFAFSLVYFVTWGGLGTNMYFALINGGPVAYLFNFIIVFAGVLGQAACLAELSSIMPIAGAQYYWTYAYSPPKYRLFLTWIQGWATWLAFVAGLASVINGTIVNLEASVQINFTDYVAGGWHTTVIVMAMLAFCTILNCWFFELVPWIELSAGILNVVFFLIFFVALWVMSPRNPGSFILTRTTFSGWENEFVSWNVGMLTQIWLFISFECVIHMGEETKNARRAVPQAMFWSIVVNGVLGFLMIITYIICMPPVEDLVASSNPFIYLLKTALGSDTVTTVLVTGITTIGVGCCLSSFSSTTRLTWAWARDGGLPLYFGHVDGKHRVPMRAVLLTCALVMLLALLNIGTSTYVAFGAITSLSSLASYVSYALILSVSLYARLTVGLKTSEWSMGRLGTPINVFALVYTLYCIIWLPFPTTVPVTATSMNYCGPVFIAVMAGAVGSWFVWAKNNWAGPNQGVAEIVMRSTEAN